VPFHDLSKAVHAYTVMSEATYNAGEQQAKEECHHKGFYCRNPQEWSMIFLQVTYDTDHLITTLLRKQKTKNHGNHLLVFAVVPHHFT
jgi:hypothetical protein